MAYDIGVQTFTYREFSVEGICEALSGTDVSAVEPYRSHVGPDDGDEEVEETLDAFDRAGLDVCGYGVVGFDDPAEVRDWFAFVDRLGASYVSVDFAPDDDATIEAVVEAADGFGVDAAIHNHGPDHRYSTVEDVLAVLEAHPHERLGACVDTGHFFRSGQAPDEVIPAIGDRVHALHLKDFVDAETEVVPGDGNLDIAGLLSLLDGVAFDAPLVIEYEEDPEDPTPAVLETIDRVRDQD